MESVTTTWKFVISLVAVINGLGVVRLLVGLSDYIKYHKALNIQHYWVYTLVILFQLLIHLLLWWTIIGLYQLGDLGYLSYLYLLIGPTLLFLGTSFVIPDSKVESLDLRSEYYSIRKTYFSLMAAFYLWAIFVWPVLGHSFAPTVPLIIIFFLIALSLRITAQPKIHAILIIVNYVFYTAFVVLFTMHLDEFGHWIAEH